MVLTAKDGTITLARAGRPRAERLPDGDPLEALRGLVQDPWHGLKQPEAPNRAPARFVFA